MTELQAMPMQSVRKSSFYTALRILPRDQRQAMYEIYAFCRAVDDIADEGGPREARRLQLLGWREAIDDVFAGQMPGLASSLAGPVKRFGLRRADFQAVIDGMDMDVAGDIRAPDLATLDLYCDRVASAVGRLSVRVFGMNEPDGVALAHHLGRALQLTNILRDIDEDADIGRLYLPREFLQAAGIMTKEPHLAIADPAIGLACTPLLATARRHFGHAQDIIARSPRRSVRTPRLMAQAYGTILSRLEVRGWSPPRARIKISKASMLLLVLRHGLI